MRFTASEISRVSLFSALHVAAAVSIRFAPEAAVPFSLVPFAAFMAAFVLGGRSGAASLVVYVALGLSGVPVFARPPYGGLTYVLQPTFGFLIGFILAAYVAGSVNRRYPQQPVLAVLAGVLILYMVGVPYFMAVIRFYLGREVSFGWVMQVLVVPFLWLDLLKGYLAARMASAVSKRMKRAGISL